MSLIGVEPGGDAVRVAKRVHYPTCRLPLVARHEKADGDTETGVRRIGSGRKDCWRELAYRQETDGCCLRRVL